MSEATKAELAPWRRWIPQLGVLVGSALGQCAELFRQKRWLRRYYGASYTELQDVHSALKTRVHAVHEALATFLETHAITSFPTQIDHSIFRAWFADCAPEFTESERLSLTHIYGHVDNLNWQFSQMRDNWDLLSGNQVEDLEKKRCIIRLMEGAYVNGCKTDAMIELALLKRAKSDIRALEATEHIAKATMQAEAELRKLAEAARQRQKDAHAAGKDRGNR